VYIFEHERSEACATVNEDWSPVRCSAVQSGSWLQAVLEEITST